MAAEYEVNIKINTQQIERELKKIDKAVNSIGKSKKGGRASGLGLMPGDELKRLQQSRIYLGQAVQSIDRLAKIQDRRARSLNKINELEAKGLSVGRLRRQLVKATTEQSRRRLGSAEKEFRVLEKSIRLEQSKLRILKEQRKGFAASPVGGTRTMMGSPAQIAAAARAGGATSPIRGGLNFPGSPIALAGATVSRTPFGPSFPTGGAALPIGGSTAIPGSPKAIQAAKATELRATQVQGSWSKALGQLQETAKIFESRNAQVRQSWTTALGQLSETAKNISTNRTARVKQSWATALGQLEETAKDISSNRAVQRGKRRRQRLEQVGLGAGFPLLFGGGPGAVLGGAAGGLTGSFGAQIAFSAIGQQIDKFVAGVAEAGKAFGSLEGVLSLMSERSLFTSKSSEELAQQLQELGDVEALAELATVELASKIGSDGIEAFQDLETELDEFDRLVGHLMISLQAFVAGPLGDFLDIVNATLGKKVTQGTIDRLEGSLQDPGDQARFRAAAKQRIGTELEIQGFGLGGLPRSAEVLKSAPLDLLSELSQEVAGGKFGESNLLSRPLRVTRQDRKSFKPSGNTEAEKAAREEARIQKRLGKLEEERKKVLEISRFKDKIAAAEASRDEQLVIRLKGEQQIAEIEAKRKQDLVDITDQRLIDQININAATKKLTAHRDTERELAEFQKTSAQERFNAMQKHIEQQYELNEAVKQQRALAEGISQVMGEGMARSFDLLIDGANNWGTALQDIAANVLRDIAKQLIQIYVIEQAVGFLRNFLTPLDPSTLLGENGGQVGRFGTLGPNYGIPQFANGGNPPVGRPSLVGERGPELFVPRSAGTIVPNHALGGANIVVNVDASGTQAQGDQPNAKALGNAIGAAVQAELVRQKRPGGLLSS